MLKSILAEIDAESQTYRLNAKSYLISPLNLDEEKG
jgi:hypothetical protein